MFNADKIYKNLRAFKSYCNLKDLLTLRATVEKQIKEDKKKKTKAAQKRIEKNQDWLVTYDFIINFASYAEEVNRIDCLAKLHNKRI